VVVELGEEAIHDENSGVEVTERNLKQLVRLLPFLRKWMYFSHDEVEQSKSTKELVNGQLSVVGVVGLEKDVFVEEFINAWASQRSQHLNWSIPCRSYTLTLFMSALNLSLGLRKTSLVSLLKTGEKFSSSKSRDFNSILEIILSSYSL